MGLALVPIFIKCPHLLHESEALLSWFSLTVIDIEIRDRHKDAQKESVMGSRGCNGKKTTCLDVQPAMRWNGTGLLSQRTASIIFENVVWGCTRRSASVFLAPQGSEDGLVLLLMIPQVQARNQFSFVNLTPKKTISTSRFLVTQTYLDLRVFIHLVPCG